jgi:Ethanolamine utilization protein EutJ (predicted chaperonin)
VRGVDEETCRIGGGVGHASAVGVIQENRRTKTMAVRDQKGNVLEKGNVVVIHPMQAGIVLATVEEIREGGVVAVGGSRKGEAQVTPGCVVLNVRYEMYFDPNAMKHGGHLSGVVRVVEPDAEKTNKVSLN